MGLINLHTHTTHSLLDGCADIGPLVARAVELEMPALAITDHGTLSGSMEFYLECRRAGIKPIIGVEMYVDDSPDRKGEYRHVVLLAKNLKGFRNLLQIVSEAHVRGFYYKPRTSTETIFKYGDGIIAMTACMGGIIAKLLTDDGDRAEEEAIRWRDRFEKDFYIELQVNELPAQEHINKRLLTLAHDLDIKSVITLDSHYVNPEDIELQDFILAVREKKTINDKKRFKYSARSLYLMDDDELWKLSRKWKYFLNEKTFNKLVVNSERIADKCNLTIPTGAFHLPNMQVNRNEFRKMVEAKAKKKKIFKKKEYQVRLKHELDIITKLGFHDYFLIVEDLVRWCRRKGIFVGPARGSVAGSLAAYAVDITKIDPMKYGLLFERFLNEQRVDMPDIDLDFDANKRERVFEYIKEIYGRNKVARVISFGTFGKVGSLRDIGRVYQLPLRPINEIANAIYKVDSIRGAYKTISGALKDFWREHITYIKLAEKVSGLIRNASVHPCGTIIAPRPVYKYCPLQRVKGEIVSAFSEGLRGRDLSEVGLIKFDILGLNTCSIISDTIDLVKKVSGENLAKNIWKLDIEDDGLLQQARRGNTTGMFQFETEAATSLLKKIKPDSFEEIAALNAINRPGPLGSGAVERFITREGMGIENDAIDEILEETRGVLVYQEQVMQILNRVAGYSFIEADNIRKLAAKKIFDTDKKLRIKFRKEFLNRCAKLLDRETATELWKIIGEFTKYSFNKSHAVSYAYLFFQVLYLKNYYPREFFASLLSNTKTGIEKDRKHGSEQSKLNRYLNEARKYGLKIYNPDINKSGANFTLEKDGIRFGLSKIKGIKAASAEEIITKRPFNSFPDFLGRISGKIHKGKISSLILAGCFDSLGDRQSIKRQFNSVRKEQVLDIKKSFVEDAIEAYGFILFHPFAEEKVKQFLLKRYCVSSLQLQGFNRWERVGVAGIIISIDAPMTGKSAKVLKIQDHRGEMFIYLDKAVDKRHGKKLKEFEVVFISGRLMGNNRILCHGNKDSLSIITDQVADRLDSPESLKGGLV